MMNRGDFVIIHTTSGRIIQGRLDVICEGTCQFWNITTANDQIIPLAQIEEIVKAPLQLQEAIKKRLATGR